MTALTCGSADTLVSSDSTCACTAGSVTLPSLAAITIWSRSPEALGALRCSRCTASKLCVPDRLKLSLYAVPALDEIAIMPISATNQASTTQRLWAKQNLASPLIDLFLRSSGAGLGLSSRYLTDP